MLDARLEIVWSIEAAPQRTEEGRQFQVVAAEKMLQLAPAGLRQLLGRQLPRRRQLDAARASPAQLIQAPAQRQPQGGKTYADLRLGHCFDRRWFLITILTARVYRNWRRHGFKHERNLATHRSVVPRQHSS